MSPESLTVDADAVRDVHRRFLTGVTVVTTMDGEVPKGLAVNAFCSVSLDPPTVLVSVQQSSSTYPALVAADHLAVNILSASQLDVAQVFASKSKDKFATLDWYAGPHGSPVLNGSSASVEIAIEQRLHAGSHTLFYGQVVHAQHAGGAPLLYWSGNFFDPSTLHPLDH